MTWGAAPGCRTVEVLDRMSQHRAVWKHAWAQWQRDGVWQGKCLGLATVPAGRLRHLSRFDQTPARFTAIAYAAGVHGHHLVKIIPLRMRGLKTFGTMATPKPGGRLPHEHELAMRAGAHRTYTPWQGLAQSGSGTRALRMVRGPHGVSLSVLLGPHRVAGRRGRVVARQHTSLNLSEFVFGSSCHKCARVGLDEAPLLSRAWRRNREEMLSFSASFDARSTAIHCATCLQLPLRR
jgi:hypothetical protein